MPKKPFFRGSAKKSAAPEELPIEPAAPVDMVQPAPEVAPEPVVPAPKPSQPESLGSLGKNQIKINQISRVVINGREYNKVYLANGTTELLSDADLEKQLTK